MGEGEPLRVILVEDNPRYREGLATFLRHAPGFELVAVHPAADSLLAEIERAPAADLVLMDIELPRLSGIEATRRLKAHWPEVKVVMITVFEEPTVILVAITAGADGYLLKRSSARELIAQLELVARGGAPLTAGVASTVLELLRHAPPAQGAGPAPERFGLTEREQETLRGLVDGLSYQGVADRLGISLHTVRHHVRSVYRKLQVNTSAEAVRIAIRRRLI